MRMLSTTAILFFIFMAYILLATTPMARIERACMPVVWTGNVTESVALLLSPRYAKSTERWFQKTDYGCRYVIWRFFYEEEYLEYKKTSDGSDGTSLESAEQDDSNIIFN